MYGLNYGFKFVNIYYFMPIMYIIYILVLILCSVVLGGNVHQLFEQT